MYRRKVMVAAAAVFALGFAFGAEPLSERDDRSHESVQQRTPWVPGRNMLMSAHEASPAPSPPPP